MARTQNSPQVEDGYIRIANSLLEAIMSFGFTQRELLVLMAIMRKTYGFNKKADDMSASQISALCKVSRQHVASTLVSLASRNVILKSSGQFGSIIGIQKDHRKWVGVELLKAAPASPESGQVASPDSGQGSPDSGQGVANNEKGSFSDDSEEENGREGTPALTSDSPDSGHPCPDMGHVPIQVSTCPESGQVASPDSGHTKDNLPKDTKQKTYSSSGDDVQLCPVGTLVNLYHELMPKNPRVAQLTEGRKKAIRARWAEAAKLEAAPFGYSTKSAGLEAWRTFFAYCAKSDFLTGGVPGRDGKKPFRAGVDFLFSPSGFTKALEGTYHPDTGAPSASDALQGPDAWRAKPQFRGVQ